MGDAPIGVADGCRPALVQRFWTTLISKGVRMFKKLCAKTVAVVVAAAFAGGAWAA